MTCLPSGQYGTNNAAIVASNMRSSFPTIRAGLMVGVGGGVPGDSFDIRLGDVVVGTTVIQYDLGKILPAPSKVEAMLAADVRESKTYGMQQKLQYRRAGLFELLRFEQLDSRHTSIKAAHRKTCEWLPKHEASRDWFDPSKLSQQHGFLLISGKPGAGKSTLMKFTLNSVPSNRDPQKLFRNAILSLGQRSLTCFVDALDECSEGQVEDMVRYFEDLGKNAD
ncbi:hypothetical protein LY76DRAFT_671376 [Colletotrichum caudatum]|nr:hypothetical protein LY76DRAFT_671376 [Colletotrichum caudatum]